MRIPKIRRRKPQPLKITCPKQEIYSLLTKRSELTAGDIQTLLGYDLRTARRALRQCLYEGSIESETVLDVTVYRRAS